MRIYKSEHGHFYFSQYQDKGWFCFSDSKPDIYTLNLCPVGFGYNEEKEAWDKAIEVPTDKYVWFNKIAQQKNNYCDVCSFIKEFYDVSQEELDRQFGHYPSLIELTDNIIGESGHKENLSNFNYRDIYDDVKYYMQLWDNDVERIKKYVKEHDIPKYTSLFTPMIDVFGECHSTKRLLLHDFYRHWGDRLDKIIDKAIELYPDEKDFDKAYYYVKDNINGIYNKKTL